MKKILLDREEITETLVKYFPTFLNLLAGVMNFIAFGMALFQTQLALSVCETQPCSDLSILSKQITSYIGLSALASLITSLAFSLIVGLWVFKHTRSGQFDDFSVLECEDEYEFLDAHGETTVFKRTLLLKARRDQSVYSFILPSIHGMMRKFKAFEVEKPTFEYTVNPRKEDGKMVLDVKLDRLYKKNQEVKRFCVEVMLIKSFLMPNESISAPCYPNQKKCILKIVFPKESPPLPNTIEARIKYRDNDELVQPSFLAPLRTDSLGKHISSIDFANRVHGSVVKCVLGWHWLQ